MEQRRTSLPASVRDRIDSLLGNVDSARDSRDWATAWRLLEDVYVLSQPWIRAHMRVHLAMLSLGWSQRDRAEIVGQLGRLLGNTGDDAIITDHAQRGVQ